MKQTIYQYIIDHLDADGCFTTNCLCDDRISTILKPLGTEDAFFYTMGAVPNTKAASTLLKQLRTYLASPEQQHCTKLYTTLEGMVFSEYFGPFIEAIDADEINITALELARRFLYNAKQREPVKFAFLLFGLYGMERIKNTDPDLWHDLLRIAHCEEFTFPFISACHLTQFHPQDEIWELIRCTHSWGKVAAILDCRCRNKDERLWLLIHGPEIDVEYPPLAVKFITEIRLQELLAQPVDYELYKNAIIIVGNYLIMLTRYPLEQINEHFTLDDIDLNLLLTELLQQAQRLADGPEDILDMLTYSMTLQELVETQNQSQISANQAQLIIAACDKLIYSKDWSEDIAAKLISDGTVNYQLCDLAYELDFDVWQLLFDFWLAHPDETALFPYLLSFEGGLRSERVLKQIEQLLPHYSGDADALLVPLRYLNSHPGQSEAIICAALESIYDLYRGIACGILDEWGKKFITPAIKQSLLTASRLSNNPVVSARIDSLLQGRKFDMNKMLQGNKQ